MIGAWDDEVALSEDEDHHKQVSNPGISNAEYRCKQKIQEEKAISKIDCAYEIDEIEIFSAPATTIYT